MQVVRYRLKTDAEGYTFRVYDKQACDKCGCVGAWGRPAANQDVFVCSDCGNVALVTEAA